MHGFAKLYRGTWQNTAFHSKYKQSLQFRKLPFADTLPESHCRQRAKFEGSQNEGHNAHRS